MFLQHLAPRYHDSINCIRIFVDTLDTNTMPQNKYTYPIPFLSESVMYWCDNGTNRIEKANLDGTDRKTVAVDPESHFFGITLDETYLYVTDWTKR